MCYCKFNMLTDEDIEQINGLGVIENASTIDTTKADDVKAFIDCVRAMERGQGAELWALISRLPAINDAKGLAKTMTRVIKYIQKANLINRDYDSKFHCLV